MAEAVVILTPDVGGEQIVQRRDGPTPWNVASDFEPFRVLVEHGIDDVDEGFVAGEETVASGEEITFEPTLAKMFAEDLDDAAIARDVLVSLQNLALENAIGGFEDFGQAVGFSFVRTHDSEVALLFVE